MRKVIQIHSDADNMYALCDDGTMWVIGNGEEGWCEIIPIPQPEDEKKEPQVTREG